MGCSRLTSQDSGHRDAMTTIPTTGGAPAAASPTAVELYWIPLGAGVGGAVVRWSGRVYETAAATLARRPRCSLYHSALVVKLHGAHTAIEMAPVWVGRGDRGVVSVGPVGAPFLGRSPLFRYGVRRWLNGSIPDLAAAIGGPRQLCDDALIAERILDLVPSFPTATWGRDELGTGEMWNSNSLVSWLLVRAGLDLTAVGPPEGGRAPGWHAGLIAATRDHSSPPERG